MPPEAKLSQLYQQEVKATYNNWTGLLSLLRETTDPKVKTMWIEELEECYAKAQQLSKAGTSYHNYLNIILSRPIQQWVILAKGNDNILKGC
jgi:hypothetical protein